MTATRKPLARYVQRAAAAGAIPDVWQDVVPRCDDCARTLIAHKGHWVCAAPGCPLCGASQGDAAPEVES